jgi:SWI/SNF related-matrix-associated actin-dependent regulator of chromatin subfamily C
MSQTPTENATGDVVTHDVATAPGKERERDPLYSGDIANISQGMDVDTNGGEPFYLIT